MKINKLLFFLLALVSFNSCVEYVDNGTKTDGPEPPEEQKYTAEQANPEEAKYIGDTFEFKAMLNGTNVTSTTKFKINGSAINGKTYVPHKTGSHSVIATMDNYEATFKFTVLEKDEEEPEPTGNRIEYGGKDYPLNTTQWILLRDSTGEIIQSTVGGKIHVLWAMVSMDGTEMNNSDDLFLTVVYVPTVKGTDGKDYIAIPNQVNGSTILHDNGEIVIDGVSEFDTANATYVFAATGNTQPNLNNPAPYIAQANYTGKASGASSGESADLFWNGDYEFFEMNLPAKGKGVNSNTLMNAKKSPLNIKKSFVIK